MDGEGRLVLGGRLGEPEVSPRRARPARMAGSAGQCQLWRVADVHGRRRRRVAAGEVRSKVVDGDVRRGSRGHR